MSGITSALNPSDMRQFLEDLYEGPVRLTDLQSRLLSAASNGEEGGPTPEKDQKIQEIIYNYVQSKKGQIGADQADKFAAVLAWICVGKELANLLASVPKSSLDDLMEYAAANGYDVTVAKN
ncbi:hypothetical protein [Aliiroseovarius sp.]|uniref:hypothetical protein n=1 Tax=Aliiroseovarius sp. TaxID=1872442 RepID=UPI003BAB6DF4